MNGSTDPYASTGSSAYHGNSGADEALQQTAQQALGVLSDSYNVAKEQVCQVWDDLRPQLDKVAAYAKEEPTKSVLMAAAAGAVLVTVAMAAGRSRRSVDVEGSKEWLRSLADEAADQTRSVARRAADEARDAADRAEGPARRKLRDYVSTAAEQAKSLKEDAVDSAKSMKESAVDTARRAASQAYEGASERLSDLRHKADPLIDRFEPQIEQVAGYTKQNPFAALVAAALVGALVSRLAK